MSELTKEILQALLEPFPANQLEFRAGATGNGQALALAFIDARDVMSRLDKVVGPDGWSFDFDLLSPDGKMVRGRLTVCGVTKCDAGQADKEDEALKSAVSDALKRAAVHFGIGRYLNKLPPVWAPYDAQKKRFSQTPRLDSRAVSDALRMAGYEDRNAPVRQPESRGDAGVSQPPAVAPAEDGTDFKGLREKVKTAYRKAGYTSEDPVEFYRVLSGILKRQITRMDGLTADELRHCAEDLHKTPAKASAPAEVPSESSALRNGF